MSDYSLEVISHHPEYNNRQLRKYNLEGIDTIGAWGDEPFEIKFKNNTWKKIQVRLSLDGTDILTGEPATTEATGKMWLVNPYATLSIQAWPESNNGGARFVFTNAKNSVALNTHGDMSSRGIIAAAVYVEGHVEPQRVDYHIHHYDYHPYGYKPYFLFNNDSDSTKSVDVRLKSRSLSKCIRSCSSTLNSDSLSLDETSYDVSEQEVGDLKSLASVGAGEYVNQHISYVEGLIKPVLSDTLRIKYLWWDELRSKLEKQAYVQEQPSGFPGDKGPGFIKLGDTPRIKSVASKGVIKRVSCTDSFTRF